MCAAAEGRVHAAVQGESQKITLSTSILIVDGDRQLYCHLNLDDVGTGMIT